MSTTRQVARAKRDAEGNILSEQVTPEVQAIIDQWARDHSDDLNERLAPLGLGDYNIVGPDWRQIILEEPRTYTPVFNTFIEGGNR